MTQLDRLEALAEKVWVVDIGRGRDDIGIIKNALPDLIRVARIAAVVADHQKCPYRETFLAALAPLYREVES